MKKLELGRDSLYNYGSLEETIQEIRAHRPMDLNSPRWRAAHPDGTYEQWRQQARKLLLDGLHYDPGPVDLKAQTEERVETDEFVRERIWFNTTPWFRVPGYFYVPKNVKLPAPALVVFHEWGGPILFGAERVCCDAVHPIITDHRNTYTSGRAISDWYASQGYCVITIDAYHFGNRAPRGLHGVPKEYDPKTIGWYQHAAIMKELQDLLYLGVRQLNWAGTTWCGVNYWDDSRCVDYLLSRPEVDGDRIGCTGLSGGGWRTNIMAALEERIKASVTVGWMTTGDHQQAYNVGGAVGTFALLPGVWNHIDLPDTIAMAAPKACMVVSGTEDPLNPPVGQALAAEQIQAAYEWAGCPEKFGDHRPKKVHCYDADIQDEALRWFDKYLKG